MSSSRNSPSLLQCYLGSLDYMINVYFICITFPRILVLPKGLGFPGQGHCMKLGRSEDL